MNAIDHVRLILRRSWDDSWKLLFAAPLWTVGLAALIGLLNWYLQFRSLAPMVSAFAGVAWTLVSTVIVFAALFLFHVFYLTPKRIVSETESQLEIIVNERDTLRRKVAELSDAKENEGQKTAYECFKRAAELLKHGEEAYFPFHALCKAGGHLLETNTLVWETCSYLVSYGYGNPFAGLEEYVPESDYHDFLVWIHYSPEFDPLKGTEYLCAAEAWRIKKGYPPPSEAGSLSMVFSKTLDKVPPLDKKALKKGLKVSVINLSIDPPTDVILRIIFVNDGLMQRTVLAVELTYFDCENDVRHIIGGTREDVPADGSANTGIAVNPNSEATPTYRISVLTNLFKKPNTKVALQITATDGKGAAKTTEVPLFAVNPISKEGALSYTPARISSALLGEEG